MAQWGYDYHQNKIMMSSTPKNLDVRLSNGEQIWMRIKTVYLDLTQALSARDALICPPTSILGRFLSWGWGHVELLICKWRQCNWRHEHCLVCVCIEGYMKMMRQSPSRGAVPSGNCVLEFDLKLKHRGTSAWLGQMKVVCTGSEKREIESYFP